MTTVVAAAVPDRLNLGIEFHQTDGHVVKKVVRVESTTKIGEVTRLLLDKFGKSSGDSDAMLYQLSISQKLHNQPVLILSDLNKSLAAYNIKNNEDLVLRRKPKKNPASAKLSQKKKPDGIFKTLFSMSTLEMKLSEEKAFVNITDVEGQVDVPMLFFNVVAYLENYFAKEGGVSEISSSFQCYGSEYTQECIELLRCFKQNETYDLAAMMTTTPGRGGGVNVRILCNFILDVADLHSVYDIPKVSDTRVEIECILRDSHKESYHIQADHVFSPYKGITQLEGERVIFSSCNVFCIDKCNFPPSIASLGEIWVTNYRIVFVNSPNHSGNAASSSSSSSLHSNSATSHGTLQPSYSSSSLRDAGSLLSQRPTPTQSQSQSDINNNNNNNNNNSITNSNSQSSTSIISTTTTATGNIQNSSSISFSSVLNQRLAAHDNTEIPLQMIYRWKLIKTGTMFESFKIYCKDFRCKIVGFLANSPHIAQFRSVLESVRAPTVDSVFAFASQENTIDASENFCQRLIPGEFDRQGVSWDEWCVNTTNSQLKLNTMSYPPASVIPKSVSQNIVVASSLFRSLRFPVLVWHHPTNRACITRAASPSNDASNSLSPPTSAPLSPRSGSNNNINNNNNSNSSNNSNSNSSHSSNNNTSSSNSNSNSNSGMSSSTSSTNLNIFNSLGHPLSPSHSLSSNQLSNPNPCNEDIDFIRAIIDNGKSSLLTVYDIGTVASHSSTMIGCKFEFLNLPPITSVKESFSRLLQLHNGHPDKKWPDVIRFHWLNPLKQILSAAILIATSVDQGQSILVQGANNEDADTQLSSISQLLLDGYYRTIEGFKVLIEKEWLVYSNPMARRCGHDLVKVRSPGQQEVGLDQYSPTFIQFIFIVWQLWKEFPSAFQFNENYLLTLVDSVYTCRFGTFLGNSLRERDELIFGRTKSFWSFVERNQQQLFVNALYDPPAKSFLKCNRVYQDAMWNEYFYRFCFKSQVALELLDEKISLSTRDEQLDLSSLRLYHIPDAAVLSFNYVKDLNLARNNLNSIPMSFVSLVNLERLNVEENLLVNISAETIRIFAKHVVNLREINFSSNLFEDLPSSLNSFKQLQVLKLRGNKFALIPEVIDRLSLTELDLSYCQIVPRIPISLAPTLTALDLSGTHMSHLPDDIGSLTSLKVFAANENQLTALPVSMTNLKQLEKLSLDSNKFSLMPSEICQLISLRVLSMGENQMSMLPSDISSLVNLVELNLKQNKLDILPASIGQLSNLLVLNLSSNQLTSLRPTMGLLTSLTELRLDANPLKTPPPEILSQGLTPILEYLRDLIKGQEQCYRMKLMIVGQENVGKTTLLKALKDKKKKPQATGPNISTDGIDIDNWVIPAQFEELDENHRPYKKKQDVTLSVWDFAGQEIYYTTHQFFLSERSVYLVAWNIILEEEASRVEFWLQSITTRTKDAPIIIVGTHLDDSNKTSAKAIKKKMIDKYCTRFPTIKAIKLVSCTTGKGISSLRETLEQIVISQPNMGESLPRSYMLLENLVKEETKKRIIPTISWTEFMQLGTICTIKDEAELLRATMFLNQLGSLVYFPKETGLKQFVILDPQWITVMLSSIITTKHSYAKDGILSHKSLKQIWRPPLYPENLHPHLIALLEKFEISYNLGSKKGGAYSQTIDESAQSLIPSLLPTERPSALSSLWTSYNPKVHTEQFGRNYKFEFIPNGFFSRLMVRILNFAKGEARCYWRNGMLLQHENEQIFIELSNARKLLSFTVRGKQSASLSRDVIETIQSLLDDAFQLPTQIYVPCIHCIQNKNSHPFKFSLEVCENAAVKGLPYLKCQNQYHVRTELLVPDLVMSNFTGSKISYSELKLEELIGEGGAALVYRGRWKGHVVAIKKLKTVNNTEPGPGGSVEINDISLSRAFKEFRRECWIMSTLEHPNIVQLKGLCLDPLCIVTEFLPNGNLYQFLHQPNQEMSWILRLKIALDISSGMAFLHSSTPPIIHRDLKSPNILLASTDERSPVIAKVVDFGLSGLQHTITNRGVENPVWLAPEVIEKQEASTQSDVYAFGVILWELLTYQDFFGDLGFMSLLEDKVVSGERPPIPDDCPSAYAQLIRDCWQNDPNSRPSFSEVEDRIMAMVSEMFPNLQLTEPNNTAEKRRTLRSHRKHASTSSEVSELLDQEFTVGGSSSSRKNSTAEYLANETNSVGTTSRKNTTTSEDIASSITSTMTTTSAMATSTGTTNHTLFTTSTNNTMSQSNSSVATLDSSQIVGMDKSLDNLITMSQESNFFKALATTIPTTNSNSTDQHGGEKAAKIGATLTIPKEAEKKNFYHNTKRNSVSIQPFYNVFKQELNIGEGSIQCMVIAANNIWAGTGSGTISVWNKDTGEKVHSFKAHSRRIHCLYNYMNTVWSGSADNNVSIWNSETFALVKTFNGHSPTCFASVGHTVWAGSIINVIHIWDIKKKVKYKGKITLESGPVEAILKRDQDVWVALNNNLVRIDINSQRVTQMIKGHEKAIHSIIEVDSTIWTCSSDGTIRVWGAQSGQNITTINAHSSRIFCLTLVGDFVWSGSWDTSIKIWSAKDYSLVAENQSKQKDAISCFAFVNSPNKQKQVWSGSWDSTIAVWNIGYPGSLNNSFNSDMYSSGGLPTYSSSSSDTQSPSPFSSFNNNNNNSNNNLNNNNNNSNGNLTTTTTTTTSNSNSSSESISASYPNSSTLLNINSSTSPPGNSTLRSHARRTVSFVFDKFNKSSK
ncbi:leucine-rich repeat-containing protein [Heterostelium album PN500]|uniref:non-specific serine/threonine protein kinase n=1 Tax=Heterostelium pallidum (strain ATCC 26659 / Pp 5 / PN500) TaxID=670386 RepID=D3BLJ5_HETP5|nr:leucine-rich repeat-containing protein [Heterostelium album PN500]EFA77446.1 leucine-rich repeat-containing protein [Heterostelium album PN500]|eukprot:XP_020429574.1 leucine-rich repeat-containing protein [Heterostelium album PN500]